MKLYLLTCTVCLMRLNCTVWAWTNTSPAEDGASFIEWPQMAREAMPEDALHVDIAYAEDGAARVARLTAGGAFDEARIEEIRRRLEADDEHFDD